MKAQVGVLVLVLAGVVAWVAARPGNTPPDNLATVRDRLVREAGVLVAEFESGGERAPFMTRVGADAFLVHQYNREGGFHLAQTEAGQFHELLPGCWIEWAEEQELPLVPGLTIAHSLQNAPRLRNQGGGAYTYFYQFQAPRFIEVTERLTGITHSRSFTATASSGAPGGPNGVFTIREADPGWAAEARAIVASIAPSETMRLRVAVRGFNRSSHLVIVSRACPFLLPWIERTALELTGDGRALIDGVIVVDAQLSDGIEAVRRAAAMGTPRREVLRLGTVYYMPEPDFAFELRECEPVEWLVCE